MTEPPLNARKIVLVCGIATVALLAGVLAAMIGQDTIYSGVRAAGIDLHGFSLHQAQLALAQEATSFSNRTIVLRLDGRQWRATVADLGGVPDSERCARKAFEVGRRGNLLTRLMRILSVRRNGVDIPMTVAFDAGALSSRLETIARSVYRPAADARVLAENGSITVTPEVPGIELDVKASADHVMEVIGLGGASVELRPRALRPAVTARDLEGIDSVISSYATPFNAWQRARTHNLRIACKAIDGTLVKPGEVFSYNKVVGPRLKTYGFKDAPMFVRGEVEEGTGGGVCQVSTTVYNAALLANLPIRTRSPHSRPVVYAPVGRDATVAYGLVDLKFENNTGRALYLTASLEGGNVAVRIYGHKQEGLAVEITSGDHTIVPARVVRVTDSKLQPGQSVVKQPGRSGHRISIYRVVKMNGTVVRRERVSTTYYPPENRVVAVGPSI